MTRQQRQPDKRRKKITKKTGLLTAAMQAAGRTISRHPSLAGGGAAFFVVFSFVAANALWYQPGSHPSPLMTTRTDYKPRPSLPSDPQLADDLSAPREIATAEPQTSADGEPQTIEDILLPVPTHRVKSISIQQNDQTATASIPAAPSNAEDEERASAPAVEPPQQATRDMPGDTLTRDLQRELARLGLYDGVIDGLAGPKTSAALAAYGERTGLDGRPQPSPELLARMKLGQVAQVARPQARPRPRQGSSGSAAPEQATVHKASAETRYVPLVDVPVAGGSPAPSERVRMIQQGLVNIAYSDVSVDGVMGSKTREAIRDFQSHYRLPETGDPSKDVLGKLEEIGAL